MRVKGWARPPEQPQKGEDADKKREVMENPIVLIPLLALLLVMVFAQVKLLSIDATLNSIDATLKHILTRMGQSPAPQSGAEAVAVRREAVEAKVTDPRVTEAKVNWTVVGIIVVAAFLIGWWVLSSLLSQR
jgi:hypothetical protein